MIVDLSHSSPVIDHPKNPVYVAWSYPKSVMLRIGGYERGEGRVAYFSPQNARLLAADLLRRAEQAESQSDPK
jgi:hypothetical protein